MKLTKPIMCGGLLITLVLTTFGQTSSLLIDVSKPSVYISYERRGRIAPLYKGDGSERIWLRLYNNTRIPLFLCKSSVPEEYGNAGLPRNVYQSGPIGKDLVNNLGESTYDVCSVLEIPSGKATSFSVPSEELAVGRLIEIEFHFGWAGDWQKDISSGTKSLVRFGADQIPKTSN